MHDTGERMSHAPGMESVDTSRVSEGGPAHIWSVPARGGSSLP